MLCELINPQKKEEKTEVTQNLEESKGELLVKAETAPTLSAEELKKQTLFNSFKYVTDRRQKAFIETYKKMFEEEKRKAEQVSKLTKCKRFMFKAFIGLIILAFVYPMLKGMVYKAMGWELIIEPPTPPPPSRYEQP